MKKQEVKTYMYTEETIKTAIQFSRLWGIAETLEEIPIKNAEDITQMLLEWTLEIAKQGKQKQDIVKFFLEKKETYRNKE